MNLELLLEVNQHFRTHVTLTLVGRNKCFSQRMFRVNEMNGGQLARGHNRLLIRSKGALVLNTLEARVSSILAVP